MEQLHRARRGNEALRILGVDAAFDRVAADHDVVLRPRQALAAGDAQLRLDDVDARDLLGHRVLDLHARVHLDEVELVVLVQELQRAGAAVADLAAGRDADVADRLALLGRDARRRRLFDDLLVAALQRAVALAEVHHVAVVVGHHLDLDVARLLQELLHVDLGVAEGRQRFALRDVDGVQQRRVACARRACRGRRRRRTP